MTSWWQGPIYGYDLETTAPEPTEARIVTAFIGCVQPDRRIPEFYDAIVNPGVPIPDEAAAIHGVTTERAQSEGVETAVAVGRIMGHLDDAVHLKLPVVAYNAVYDFTVLACELARLGVTGELEDLFARGLTVIDPLVIDRHVDKYRKGKRTLTAACEVYGVTLDDAHSADADAAAAVEVARKLGAAHPQVGEIPAGVLHGLQAKWHADWAAGFEDYLRRQGKDETIDRAWPLREVVVEPVVDPLVAAIEEALNRYPLINLSRGEYSAVAQTAAEAARKVLQGAAA